MTANEPVAWYKKNSNDYLIENIGQPSFQVQEFIDAGYIPLYTHPVKELTLTEDEIDDVWAACSTGESDTIDMHLFAEAILKKAQEK